MRWVLIGLVVINVLYFVWGSIVSSGEPDDMRPIAIDESGVRQLRLLSEMASSSEKPAQAEQSDKR